MSRAAAIGDERRLAGYALAGAEVLPAATAADARAAWDALAEDVALVVLTPDVVPALAGRLGGRPGVVWAVVPE